MTMIHLFLSPDGRQRSNWREAFPELLTGDLASPACDAGLVWMLMTEGQDAAALVGKILPRLAGRRLIVLADRPNEDEALAVLGAGASGYCNGHAAAEVLRQVATVVANGGLWVGQRLLQRLLATTARILPKPEDASATPAWQEKLTEREQQVAHLIARGESNKEIARQLEITERTVKAHVTALLEKFAARDRLHLSLIFNGVEANNKA